MPRAKSRGAVCWIWRGWVRRGWIWLSGLKIDWVCVAVALALILFSLTTGVAQSPSSPQRTVRISVFSLFKPKALRILAAKNDSSGGDAKDSFVVNVDGQTHVLAPGSQALIELASDGQVRVSAAGWSRTGGYLHGSHEQAGGADAARFWLEVPGKLRRRFVGTLEIRSKGTTLEAVVTMPLETAVASVVQAESPPGAPLEALKAQAVATRSFLMAKQSGHVGFDFCDTTHCQFLRSPPAENSLAAQATRATTGIVLVWHDEAAAEDRTLAAMYGRSCGGRTRTLREIGVRNARYPYYAAYPYYSVRCSFCSRHPERWQRDGEMPGEEKTLPRTEQERLAYNHVHGWGAIPSLSTESNKVAEQGAGASLVGRGVGHGLGLCQLGAADMARRGVAFDRILAHYYPNTHLIELSKLASPLTR